MNEYSVVFDDPSAVIVVKARDRQDALARAQRTLKRTDGAHVKQVKRSSSRAQSI